MKYLLPQAERYYKTALHIHTDVSDGFWTPAELKACFKADGFSCVAFSDHNLITDHSDLNEEDFLALTSYEMTLRDDNPNGWYSRNLHINVLAKEAGNLWQAAKPPKLYKNSEQYVDKVEIVDKDLPLDMDSINAFIADSNAHGFLCTYNHPDSVTVGLEDEALTGFWGMEVFNYDAFHCGGGYNDEKFQRTLMRGEKVFPIISDDCHSKRSFRGSGLWVAAKELTYPAMIEALEKGDFYATNGPKIHSLTLDEDMVLRAECSEAMTVCVYSHNNFKQMQPPYCEKSPITEAKFDLKRWFDGIGEANRDKAFIRLVLTDAAGKRAYTRAYWYDELV